MDSSVLFVCLFFLSSNWGEYFSGVESLVDLVNATLGH